MYLVLIQSSAKGTPAGHFPGNPTRKLTGRFSMKYSRSPLSTRFFERCIMNNFGRNSARILASPKERYAQKNRSAQ
jgi:hypothetical protein